MHDTQDTNNGQDFEMKEWDCEFSTQRVADYAIASGDENPIHLDNEIAKGAGLEKAIVHGMLGAGTVADMVLSQADFPKLKSIRFRFKAMLPVGDLAKVQVQARDTAPTVSNDKMIKAQLINSRKEKATEARIELE